MKKNGRVAADTQTLPQAELELGKPYVKKLIKNFDQRQQAIDSGMAIRPITAAEILKHLEDFGIDSQLANGKIRQMSGGQRQRLVICAAFWSKPHVIALDEPTNYRARELGLERCREPPRTPPPPAQSRLCGRGCRCRSAVLARPPLLLPRLCICLCSEWL